MKSGQFKQQTNNLTKRSPALGVQETVGEDITSMLLEFSELERRNGNGGNDVIT